MPEGLTIALDVDGVLLDLNRAFILWVERTYGRCLDPAEITYWDYAYKFGVPKAQEPAMWTAIWDTPLYPYVGAWEFLHHLSCHSVHLVSNRPKDFHGADVAALRDFPQFASVVDSCHILNNTPKSKTLTKIGADVFVDDYPPNCVEAGLGWGGRTILLSRPWNTGCYSLGGLWMRADNYTGVLEEINDVARGVQRPRK